MVNELKAVPKIVWYILSAVALLAVAAVGMVT